MHMQMSFAKLGTDGWEYIVANGLVVCILYSPISLYPFVSVVYNDVSIILMGINSYKLFTSNEFHAFSHKKNE